MIDIFSKYSQIYGLVHDCNIYIANAPDWGIHQTLSHATENVRTQNNAK